jgi:excisionase family DNA binding protein
MKHRSAQFGQRQNPDSPRVHGLRLTVSPSARSKGLSRKLPEVPGSPLGVSASEVPSLRLSETANEVTEEETREEGQLLTVQEVAKLLRVPVSWVYGRTRKRSLERLPGYRLGKYWRFREDEILAWVKCQRGGHHAA